MRTLPHFFAALFFLATVSFAGIVTEKGRLFTSGNKIVSQNSNGEAVQLKGPSLQWSVVGWGSEKFFRTETVNALIDGWNAQVIRVPLGLSVPGDFDTGYDDEPQENWERVQTATDVAIAKDVYAIVDWHSHYGELQTNLAIDFFTNPNLAGKYGNNPHVIFEIYNEPPDSVLWSAVKNYADTVIAAIRKAGFNNLILVGNPYWDTQTDVAANNPPKDSLNNFALTFHFYADAHRVGGKTYENTKYPTGRPSAITYREVVQGALDKGIPVFVSEWGTNDATETGKPNFVESNKWHAYLDSNKISSCAWGATASTIYGSNVLDYWSSWGNPLHYNVSDLKNWTDPYRMTAHGRYIYNWLTGEDTTHAPEASFPGYSGESSNLTPDISGWFTFTDDGGISEISTPELVDGAVRLTYTIGKGTYAYDPYAAASFNVQGLEKCGYGISYLYKGAAHTLRAEQSDVEDYDFHINYKSTGKSENWFLAVIPWGFMWQSGWGGPEVKRDSSKVTALAWNISKATAKESGELFIKDVKCLEDASLEIVPIRSRQPVLKNSRAAVIKQSVNGFVKFNDEEISVFDLRGNFVGKGKKVAAPDGVYVIK